MSTTRSDITDDGNYSDDDGGGVIDQEEKYIVLRLRFHYQDNSVRYFKMKRNQRLYKLMKRYCELQNLDFYDVVFFCNGRRLYDAQTPDELDLEDRDEIEALIGWLM